MHSISKSAIVDVLKSGIPDAEWLLNCIESEDGMASLVAQAMAGDDVALLRRCRLIGAFSRRSRISVIDSRKLRMMQIAISMICSHAD